MSRELSLERFLAEYDPFLLRIGTSTNSTIFYFYPESWEKFDISYLESDAALNEQQFYHIPSSTDSEELEIASVSLPDRNILQVGFSNARRRSVLLRFRNTYILTLMPLVAISFLGGFLFSNRFLAPINKLIHIMRRIIDTGVLDERVPSRGTGDELDELTDLFNKMLTKISSLVEGMRVSLDNVAHDLRTPMTRLRALMETALTSVDSSNDLKGILSDSIVESERMQSMLRTLMDISEAETGVMQLRLKTIDLAELVSDLVEFYGYLAEEKGLSIESNLQAGITVSIDIDRFRQVVTNLLDNAIKYTPEGGAIRVTLKAVDSQAELSIVDTGVGIQEEDLPFIWDRLFRGDRSRSAPGLGLGLGLVRAIVTAHGGTVDVESREGAGSTFKVTISAI